YRARLADKSPASKPAVSRNHRPNKEGLGMFNSAEIEELTSKKRLLAAESDLNRQELMLELSRMRGSAAKFEKVVRFGRTAYPAMLVAAPLAGYFFANKAGPAKNILKSAVWGWQLIQRLKPLWDSWRDSKSSDEEPPETEISD